jgi:hypothetical protein
MMHGREKSGPAVVAVKRANKSERSAAESRGAKGRDRRECEPAKHAPGAEPGKRVTRAGGVYGRQRPPCRQVPEVGAVCGLREEAGMSLPVKVWSVQSRAGRTGASLAGVAATRGPKRRQRLDGVWN